MNLEPQRNYYRLFSEPKNAVKGSREPRLNIGYEAESTEIVFAPDTDVVFHVPFFAAETALQNTSLVESGATPGHTPATSDRIFKLRGGYGANTPQGNTAYEQDGTWLCAWLKYKEDGNHIWMDRFYNPGKISFQDAFEGVGDRGYNKINPVFTDVPSSLVLEQGGQMRYFHVGNKTATEIVSSLAGENGSRLVLDIEDWQTGGTDRSVYANSVEIDNFNETLMTGLPFVPGFDSTNSLDFSRTFVDAKVPYNDTLINSNEMTVMCWANSLDWDACPFTQLIGNYTARGGFGVFFDNLSTTPFIAIPETTYGHLFFMNENLEFYRDQNIQKLYGVNSLPSHIAYSPRDSSIIVADMVQGNTSLSKYEHSGDIVAVALDFNETEKFTFDSGETLLFVGVGAEEKVWVQTTSFLHTFDKHLVLQSTSSTPATSADCFCFNSEGNFVVHDNLKQARYIGEDLWTLGWDGILKKNNSLVRQILASDCFEVSPDGSQVWAVQQNGNVRVVSSATEDLIVVIPAGAASEGDNVRQAGFYKKADKNEWMFVTWASEDRKLYGINTETYRVEQVIDLYKGGSSSLYSSLGQKTSQFTFSSKGDFTGCEYRRIFDVLEKQKQPRLLFRSVNEYAAGRSVGTPYKRFELEVPAMDLVDNEWHLITATIKNQTVSLLVDGKVKASTPIPGNLLFTTDFQPPIYIGTPAGKSGNINNELNVSNIKFNGYVDSVKVYNFALDEKMLLSHIRSKLVAQPLIWEIDAPKIQFVDTLERVFRFRFPGTKSQSYKIRIKNSQIMDDSTKALVLETLRSKLKEISPINVELLDIEWIEP